MHLRPHSSYLTGHLETSSPVYVNRYHQTPFPLGLSDFHPYFPLGEALAFPFLTINPFLWSRLVDGLVGGGTGMSPEI
jgi:hypothetical protein